MLGRSGPWVACISNPRLSLAGIVLGYWDTRAPGLSHTIPQLVVEGTRRRTNPYPKRLQTILNYAASCKANEATRNQRIRRCSGAAVAASGTPTFGVHHRTALVACQVIANNAFDTGCFTLDGDGLQRLNIPPDGILTGGKYYLILGEGPSLYPIMPSFLDWEFAYGRIPEPWNQAPVTASSTTSDCAVTNYSLCTEQAHIVPREEETCPKNCRH
ncbi:predicted protein [Histoplasma mississippiense (nom. inval.)]|uniref:predicted protein n=1 Tax=Ajellomyces capsulatus (strain NAm1 / WU24) TaxID=2059318 RepID=UPI000157D0B2|nr:predicted protein [Histoplasma mississippiense (nom. inval.)]EDN10862.1 predicted protein [Histoplasma mississippiense (nom. inval.)]